MVEAVPPGYEQAIELWAAVLISDVRAMRALLDMVMGDGGRRFLDLAEGILPAPENLDTLQVWMGRSALARGWHAWFADHPLLLSPVWSQPAFEHGADLDGVEGAAATLELMRPILPANLLGLPSAVVSCGLADGLPVGAQLTGPRFSDLRCLAVAEQLEARCALPTPIDPR